MITFSATPSTPQTATSWKNIDLGPLSNTPVQSTQSANPASMTLEEALGEKPKKNNTLIKIVLGTAALVGALRLGAIKGKDIKAAEGFKGFIKNASDKIIEVVDYLPKKIGSLFGDKADDAAK